MSEFGGTVGRWGVACQHGGCCWQGPSATLRGPGWAALGYGRSAILFRRKRCLTVGEAGGGEEGGRGQ